MMPGETAFARIPLFAYSIARDFVAEFRPPFVSDASTDGTPLIAWSVRVVVIADHVATRVLLHFSNRELRDMEESREVHAVIAA
jgi:hypothetical protein